MAGLEEEDDDDSFADDDEDGGSFADNDDIFDAGIEDDTEGNEGSFREKAHVFATPRTAPEPHSNRLTTQAAEDAQYETPKPTALEAAKKDGVLVAKWMSNNPGDFRVAWSINNKLVEAWRAPTQREFELFKEKGRWLKGGLKQSQSPAATGKVAGVDAADTQTFWQKHKKKILGIGAALAVVGGGYVAYKKWWAEDGDVEDTR